ncbi:hypothetical protein JX265_004710 [Neoarthrinium moseri]|uniref:Uncharacterized protein n=1 Tax=Neoarthrinium moseri TaxID=1658444 RepID=A0A9P9WPZ8_9PEZI|nr:hypothetical protein JX265_004710 [Neoarthrinium moseri]
MYLSNNDNLEAFVPHLRYTNRPVPYAVNMFPAARWPGAQSLKLKDDHMQQIEDSQLAVSSLIGSFTYSTNKAEYHSTRGNRLSSSAYLHPLKAQVRVL